MQHRHRFFPIFLIALTLAVPAGATAQDKPAPKNPYVERFKELDRNRDGYVSLTEWPK